MAEQDDYRNRRYATCSSAEYLYNKTLNAVHYYEANLQNPVGTLGGVDNRPRFGGTDATVRVNNNTAPTDPNNRAAWIKVSTNDGDVVWFPGYV